MFNPGFYMIQTMLRNSKKRKEESEKKENKKNNAR